MACGCTRWSCREGSWESRQAAASHEEGGALYGAVRTLWVKIAGLIASFSRSQLLRHTDGISARRLRSHQRHAWPKRCTIRTYIHRITVQLEGLRRELWTEDTMYSVSNGSLVWPFRQKLCAPKVEVTWIDRCRGHAPSFSACIWRRNWIGARRITTLTMSAVRHSPTLPPGHSFERWFAFNKTYLVHADPSKKNGNSYLDRTLADVFHSAESTVLVALFLVDSKMWWRTYDIFQIVERACSTSISSLESTAL